jgi:hypothetical protein
MVATLVRIAPLVDTGQLDDAHLRDLIYAQVRPQNGIEHIRARAGPHGVDILAFVDGNDPQAAADVLRSLVNELISSNPLLRLWRIV